MKYQLCMAKPNEVTMQSNGGKQALNAETRRHIYVPFISHPYHYYRKAGLATSLGDDIDGIDNPRDVTENGQQQTDPELHMAAKLEEDPERRQEDGDEDIDEVGCSFTRHVC